VRVMGTECVGCEKNGYSVKGVRLKHVLCRVTLDVGCVGFRMRE